MLAGDDGGFFAAENIGAEVDMPAFDAFLAIAGAARERDDRLRNVVPRILDNRLTKFFVLSFVAWGPMSMP